MALKFDEPYYTVPAAAQETDPAADMRDLLFRLGKAESSLREAELQSSVDAEEILREVINLADSVLEAVEAADASSDIRETAVVNGLIGFAKTIHDMLERHGVSAIVTIGLPFDTSVATAVGYESGANVPSGIVLRERRIGYRWPGGVLRKAEVIVSGKAAQGYAGAQDATHRPAPIA